MMRCGDLVQPLINLMRDKLLEAPLVHFDETVTQVLYTKKGSELKSVPLVLHVGSGCRTRS
ncbi:IS66 family transposase [Endozoicomonas ascidiicola]|uniref:IS66 family transposase n=1 Tax=Endozoicomonas ascidiicola TaxID=1698521 RepID=UPI0034552A8F